VGLLAGVRRIPTTVLHLDDTEANAPTRSDTKQDSGAAIFAEAKKGYGFL